MKTRFEKGLRLLVAVCLLVSSAVFAQQKESRPAAGDVPRRGKYAPAFPRQGALLLQQNEYFAIWEVTRAKGMASPMYELPLDQVSVTLAQGAVKYTKPDGSVSIEQEGFAFARYESKGTIKSEEGMSDIPSRAIVFQVKSFVPPKWPITEGVPPMFPRVGAVKLFETDRFNVWDQTWYENMLITRHSHYTPFAGVYLREGVLRLIEEGKEPGPSSHRRFGRPLLSAEPLKVPHEEEHSISFGPNTSPRVFWVELKY